MRNPVRIAFWLAVLAALVAVGDALVTALGREQFLANVGEYGWAIPGEPPHDGTRQRFVFCLSVAVVVAAAAVYAAFLITRPRPSARSTVLFALPLGILLDLFTVVYSPDSIGSEPRDGTPAGHAAGEAAFERLFPLWYTGGHALAVGLLALLTVLLVLRLRQETVREYFEYGDPEGLRPQLTRAR